MNTPAFTHLAAALVAESDDDPVDVEWLAVLVSGAAQTQSPQR